jgi:hypothetical protein
VNGRTGRTALAAVGIAAGWFLAPRAAPGAQAEAALTAFVGTWTIDLARSRMGRAGPGGTQTQRSNSFTWVFSPDATGLRMNIYTEYPARAPSTTLSVVADGRLQACEMQKSCLGRPGDPKEQHYAFTLVNPNVLTRVFQVRGAAVEYNVYAVSKDGKTFVATSWSPETPEYQNVQVFDRQP